MECMKIRTQINCDNCKYHKRRYNKTPCNKGIYEINKCNKSYCSAWKQMTLFQTIFYNIKITCKILNK